MWDLERMKGLASKGKVSRRDFIQFALAAGVSVAAAETMFAEAARAAPKQGGFFRMALGHGATTDSMDPGTYTDSYMMTVGWGSLGNSLTEVDYKGDIKPDLAESMEPADDAKSWVFKLRKGLTFHNGKSVTPTDVVESFRFHMGKDSKSAAKSLLQDVTDIKADGPDTVIFSLKAASADFPYIASDYHIPIMPAEAGGGVDWKSGIRTGPYMLESFNPGVSTKMKRNPNYHGKTWFDEVEVLSIIDVTARTNALTSGAVQYIDRCDLKTLNLLRRQPGIKIWEGVGYGHYVMPMFTDVAPFDNVDVRTALKYAVNREDILKKVFLGHGKVGNDDPIAPGIKYVIDPQPKHAYDPDKAKFHLKKAGLSTLKVDLSAADAAFAGAVDAAVLYQQHAKAAGIDINVIREPNDGYWDNVWLKKPWVASYWNGRPTIDWMFTMAYAADAAWNDTHWKNPKFNELLVAARSETDAKKRAAMYAECQQLLHDDGGL
ncbi:MAG TPA: ABC transporter substrate-binding protein, partial [Gemmataceae bacterium]|nr:ABC transporter substrate-binding protein [Gemmataceae bacterium]